MVEEEVSRLSDSRRHRRFSLVVLGEGGFWSKLGGCGSVEGDLVSDVGPIQCTGSYRGGVLRIDDVWGGSISSSISERLRVR